MTHSAGDTMTEQKPRYERFGWDSGEFEKVSTEQSVAPQQDPSLRRWLDLGFSPEESADLVKLIG